MSLRKKLLCLVLCTVIVSSLGVTAWADSVTVSSLEPVKQDILAQYVATETDIVYSVDLNWGSLLFKYIAGEGTWNPSSHEYDTDMLGWVVADSGGDALSITNHSNTAISAIIEVAPTEEYPEAIPQIVFINELTNSEMKDTITTQSLGTAVGTDINNAPSKTVLVEMTGSLSSAPVSNVKVGTVTVTITPQ